MERQEFVELLHTCIRDEFVATTTVTDSVITIRFVDGTVFSIAISEQ